MKQARPELYSRPARRRFQGFLKVFRQGHPQDQGDISIRPTGIYHRVGPTRIYHRGLSSPREDQAGMGEIWSWGEISLREVMQWTGKSC